MDPPPNPTGSPSWRPERVSSQEKSSQTEKPELIPPTIIDLTVKPAYQPEKGSDQKSSINPISYKKMAVADLFAPQLGKRLTIRKALHRQLTMTTDIMCAITVISLVLMVAANEISFTQVGELDTPGSWFIKLMISVSTVVLLALILVYHRLDLALYSVKNSVEDWRVGLTIGRVVTIFLEILICSIHPMPRMYPTESYIAAAAAHLNGTEPVTHGYSYVSPDVALGIPMFLRLYLFGRFLIFHSKLARSSATQSLGYLNQVSMDVFFLIRTFLDRWPGRSLFGLSVVVFFFGSWSLRACNYRPNNHHFSLPDAIWLFLATFTTLGYGDIYPTSYCGRTVAVFITLFGILVSSLIIAVLSQKFLLERSEKYVHNFFWNAELAQRRKDCASDVIKSAMQLWAWSRKEKPHALNFLRTQQKLFHAINRSQETKKMQKRAIDNCIGPIEIINMQRTANEKVDVINDEMTHLRQKVAMIEAQFVQVQNTMENIQNTLKILVDIASSNSRL